MGTAGRAHRAAPGAALAGRLAAPSVTESVGRGRTTTAAATAAAPAPAASARAATSDASSSVRDRAADIDVGY